MGNSKQLDTLNIFWFFALNKKFIFPSEKRLKSLNFNYD